MRNDEENRVYVRVSDILGTDIDGEQVLLSVALGRYFGLSGLAKSIWDFLEVPRTEKEIIYYIMSEYEVERETCANDLGVFLLDLREKQLISSI